MEENKEKEGISEMINDLALQIWTETFGFVGTASFAAEFLPRHDTADSRQARWQNPVQSRQDCA